jgi:hypothetical protein
MTLFTAFLDAASSGDRRAARAAWRTTQHGRMTGPVILLSDPGELFLARWAERLAVGAQADVVLPLGERLAAAGIAALHLSVAIRGGGGRRGSACRLTLG